MDYVLHQEGTKPRVINTTAPIFVGDYAFIQADQDIPSPIIKITAKKDNFLSWEKLGHSTDDSFVLTTFSQRTLAPGVFIHFDHTGKSQTLTFSPQKLNTYKVLVKRDEKLFTHVIWDLRVKQATSGYLFSSQKLQRLHYLLNHAEGKQRIKKIRTYNSSIPIARSEHRKDMYNMLDTTRLIVGTLTEFPGSQVIWFGISKILKSRLDEHYRLLDQQFLNSDASKLQKFQLQTDTKMTDLVENTARNYWETLRLYQITLSGKSIKSPLPADELADVELLLEHQSKSTRQNIAAMRQILQQMEDDLDQIQHNATPSPAITSLHTNLSVMQTPLVPSVHTRHGLN